MGPGGPPAGGGGATPGPGGRPAGNPFAAAAAGADFAAPLRQVFGQRNPQGVFTPAANFNMGTAIPQLLDRFQTGTPEQRAALVQMAERGELGNFDDIAKAIIGRGAVATLRANGGVAPGQTRAGNVLQTLRGTLLPSRAAPPRSDFVINDQGSGSPLLTMRNDPAQSALAANLAQVARLGVPYNQAVVPGFGPVDFNRAEVSGWGNAPGATQEIDSRRGMSALDFIRATNRYRTATGGR
jgi:hypothetical protein